MSLKYEILKFLVKAAGIKNNFKALTVEELLEKKRKRNARTKTADLKDKDFDITTSEVMGFPVVNMIHKEPVHKACLYLIGTGMTGKPSPGDFKKALKIAKATGIDMIVPYYPLCTDYPITKSYEMVYQTYKKILISYKPGDVTVFGYSSGGNLALGMIGYINAEHPDTSMPKRIFAISPGNCLGDEEEWARMKEIDKRDVITPAEYMKMAAEIMRHGDDSVPEYMLWLQKGDYTGCPEVTLIYGSDENLYACAPAITQGLEKYGVRYQMIVGEGLYHCYPLYPLCKESKAGWNQMIGLLKKE